MKRGENVVVHGASGGVGSLALQFAKHRGARVLGTASAEDGVALVRRLGADDAVDGKHGDLEASAAGRTRSVSVLIPSRLLKPHIYMLELTGVSATGAPEMVGGYSFRVR